MEMIGKQLEVGFAVETVRGTAPAAASKWVKNVTANIIEKAEHVQDESSRGVFEDMDGRRVIKKHIEGDVESYLYANAFGYLAYNLYGSVVDALVATGVYDHTFNLLQSSIAPSLAVYAKDGDAQQLAFQNCHINTLKLEATPDEYVKITSSIQGEDAVDNSDTPSYDADIDFVGKEITIKIADSEAGLAGATPLCLSEVSIDFDKGLLLDYCLGKATPNLYTSKAGIEGSFTKNFEDETFKDLFLGDTAKFMQIKIEGEGTIGAASKPALTLTLYKVMVSNWDRSGGKDELVTEKVDFKAFYNPTSGKASTMVLRNTTAEYVDEISA